MCVDVYTFKGNIYIHHICIYTSSCMYIWNPKSRLQTVYTHKVANSETTIINKNISSTTLGKPNVGKQSTLQVHTKLDKTHII